MAVNVSAQQIRRPEFATVVKEVLEETGFAPQRLELELTENLLLNLSEVTERNLRDIRELGVRLAMDDFGTGYSSLSYLSIYPFDVIKIDRSFVSDSTSNPKHHALVAASISMAKALHLETVAEGIETADQLEVLRDLDCDYVQGFLISKARPLEEFRRFLEGWQGDWRRSAAN